MEEIEGRLYVGRKSNKRKCVKVMELGVCVYFFLFFHFPFRVIIIYLSLM